VSAPTILTKIADERRRDVEAAKATCSLEELKERASSTTPPGGRFREALLADGLSVIAEVKRASPSRGAIAGIPDVAAHAKTYAEGGAAAISVLTEPRHFQGKAEDLELVASSSGLPVLRKDFLIDPYQVWEARAWGASACLLIVALLPDEASLGPMLTAAEEAGIDALVEVHDAEELATAVESKASIIGVNHRNLHTFEIDLSLFERLRDRIPSDTVAIAESGIHSREDAARMEDAGADAILVGEHVAQADDPAAAIRNLKGLS
jgi:indole-3-glycerol phosphate synthase